MGIASRPLATPFLVVVEADLANLEDRLLGLAFILPPVGVTLATAALLAEVLAARTVAVPLQRTPEVP